MLIFVARRLVAAVVLVVLVSIGVFSLLRLAPGSVEQSLLGTRPVTPESVEAVRRQYGLDRSFTVQYVDWLGDAFRLNFGESVRTNEWVTDMISARLPVTLQLGAGGFLIALLTGIPLGVLAAVKAGGLMDRAGVAAAVSAVSSPPFFTGLALTVVFAVHLGWFPVFGAGAAGADRLHHLVLPAITLALSATAAIVQLTRAAMVQALEHDSVLAARARGVGEPRVIVHYALRNAMIPVVTSSGMVLAYMLTGAVLVERFFALNGVGSLLVDSISFKDLPVVQGITVVVVIMVVLSNLAADLTTAVIDPRLRSGGHR